ncbi:MAG: hypothetical protein QM501_08640 [Gimesia sp.]
MNSLLTIHFEIPGCLQMGSIMLLGILIALSVNYFVERRGDVNTLLMRDAWLMAVDRWLNGVRKALISVRWPSIRGERCELNQGMLRSVFLKRGTFMVWNWNWCCFLK